MSGKHPLNLILYGPPGTGKTYSTVAHAVAICEGKSLDDIENEIKKGPDLVFERYKSLMNDGHIGFVTFHQSFAYEDFVEGIRPVISSDEDETAGEAKVSPVDGSSLSYKIEDGVFKKFCDRAANDFIDTKDIPRFKNDKRKSAVWTLRIKPDEDKSLGQTYLYCKTHGCALIGWEKNPEKPEREDHSYKNFTKMQPGDYILTPHPKNTESIAVGVILGSCSVRTDLEREKKLKNYRPVEWIGTTSEKKLKEAFNRPEKIHRNTCTPFYRDNSNQKTKKQVTTEEFDKAITLDESNRYVFIIDEINRGNVSAIFGELMTLLEESKRLGNDEQRRVTLPYSKEQWGIPSNVYVIATMNTADRSLTQLDTALRRRFSFEEVMPNPKLLSKINISLSVEDDKGNPITTSFDLTALLKKMNERIEALYDREHTIGHSYFMKIGALEDKALEDKTSEEENSGDGDDAEEKETPEGEASKEESSGDGDDAKEEETPEERKAHEKKEALRALNDLRKVFSENIIPLLQEYFYDDYEKIRAILNDASGHFIKQEQADKGLFGEKFSEEAGKASSLYTIGESNSWKASDFINIYDEKAAGRARKKEQGEEQAKGKSDSANE